MLQSTEVLANKIIVLPNGPGVDDSAIGAIRDVFSVFANP